LRDTISKPGELQKELENYIRRNTSLDPAVFVKVKPFLNERVESIIKPQLIDQIEDILKSQLTKEIKRLEQEHRTISQDYNKQLDVIKEIDNDLKKPKDDDDKKALELRKTVADKEKDKLLDKLNKIEDLQNKYDDRLRELTKSAPSAATSASSTKKKPPPESDSDETVASVSDIQNQRHI
jgi:predicted  nucleic acid-binding Zn-ribbon protein